MERLKNIKLYLFDMDGTLYLGQQLYDFTKELLRNIRDSGKKYLFVTNNSSKSVNDYIKKLKDMGIAAQYEDFVTSSQATAYYLSQHHRQDKLFVCGTKSLKAELSQAGFTITEEPDQVDCIVMGFDTELTFRKLETVSKLLCTREIPYIATNGDYVCPTEFGSVPDCGSVCDMLFNVSGKRPLVIGKPATLIPELAMARTGYTAEETAMIGDRLYTDIRCGLNAGILSVLVLSGETTKEMLLASDIKPDVVLTDASELLQTM
ncbi:MAG: HAD-IIA family hydrolase [Ruminococcaceae bacterium]|nr:HAD-IIA family hydrolase [Oscillospiraceae bacterium]